MAEVFKVSMSEMRIAEAPDKLACFGIGSCVCVALYDPSRHLAGLLHAMLPSPPGEQEPPYEERGRYMDAGLPLLVAALEARGCVRQRFCAGLVGGANMFSFQVKSGEASELSLGERNLRAARKILDRLGIALAAEASGGSVGRSLELDASDGSLLVRTAWQELRWL